MGRGLPDPTTAPDVDPRQWSDAVSRTLLAERVVPGLRIPDAAGYLDDLTKARARCAGGQGPRDRSPRGSPRPGVPAPGHWAPQRQLWHYRRSLNSLTTLPQPPQRGK